MIFLRRLLIIASVCFAMISSAQETTPNMLLLGADLTKDSIIAVGERGTVLRSQNSGTSWQRIDSNIKATLTAVSFSRDGQHGWAGGHDALILATADAGLTWTIAYQGKNREDSFLDVRVISPSTIIAVGAYGLYVESRDSGSTWQKRTVQDEDSHLNRITESHDGTSLYLAGERGTLLTSSDQGRTWHAIPSPYTGSFYGILPLTGGRLIAHGLRGHIYVSDDQGDDWRPVPIEKYPLLSASIQLKSGVIVLAGQSRAFLVSRDQGKTFEPWSTPLTTGIAFLLQTRDNHLLAFGEAGCSILPSP